MKLRNEREFNKFVFFEFSGILNVIYYFPEFLSQVRTIYQTRHNNAYIKNNREEIVRYLLHFLVRIDK